MLSDILKGKCIQSSADGISMYKFLLNDAAIGECASNKDQSAHGSFELFFCCKGTIVFRCQNGSDLEIKSGESILLDESCRMDIAFIKEPLLGYSIAIDFRNCNALEKIYSSLNHKALDHGRIEKILEEHNGYLHIKDVFWNQSILNTLKCLSEKNQVPYCVLKAAELFYLLDVESPLLDSDQKNPPIPRYLAERLECVRNYIESHLEEKLTITFLCHRFNISQTTLKNKFKEFYGYSVHRWILLCRVKKAAELLECTDMTILQVAQSVGYESTSQFNLVFRRAYGIAPSLYRKKCPIQ